MTRKYDKCDCDVDVHTNTPQNYIHIRQNLDNQAVKVGNVLAVIHFFITYIL